MALTDTAIRKTKPSNKPFKMTDSSGLYLLIKPNGSKLWYMKYRIDGKEKKLAFGPYPEISLLQARRLRETARNNIRAGVDPAAVKQTEKQKKKNGQTFSQIATNWHGEHKRWSEHYAKTVMRRLEMYVSRISGIALSRKSKRRICWSLCARWRARAFWRSPRG